MSYESMVDHLRGELVTGASRRRRKEQRARRLALAAVVVFAVATAGALVAARTHEDDSRRVTTIPGATVEQLAVCHAFLDFRGASGLYDTERALTLRAMLDDVGIASGDHDLERWAHVSASVDLLSDHRDPAYFDAANALRARCKALGDPDFNPVVVPAPLPTEPNVDLATYGTVQLFGPPRNLPTFYAEGRDLSPVVAAATEAGSYVASWSTLQDGTRRNRCIAMGTASGTNASCGTIEPGYDVPPDRSISYLNFSGKPPLAVSIGAKEDVSFVVLDIGTARFVQQPVLGHASIAWDAPEHPEALTDFTIRGYDTNGVQLDCLAFGNRSC